MEIVIVIRIIYISSYGSMLIVWCMLRIYVINGNILHVLMILIFYGGLVVVSMLMVMPNGNAHHYYYTLLRCMMYRLGLRSSYVALLIAGIIILIVII